MPAGMDLIVKGVRDVVPELVAAAEKTATTLLHGARVADAVPSSLPRGLALGEFGAAPVSQFQPSEAASVAQLAALAAARVEKWYPELPPRLGARLTDSNVVLTLAGARGQTEFPIWRPMAEDAKAFARLNAVSTPEGIRWSTRLGNQPVTGERVLSVNLENPAGYEMTTSITKLPGVPRFVQSEGVPVHQWYRELSKGIEAAKQQGFYPEQTNLQMVRVGILKGYPDEAIFAAATGPFDKLVSTHIPYADYYTAAQPNYHFDVKDLAAVDAHAKQWGSLLHDFYDSPQHGALRSDPGFVAQRFYTAKMKMPRRK
jgi:hypothetical protein